jgi:hypothetical protein
MTQALVGVLAGIGLAALWVWLWFAPLVRMYTKQGRAEARHIRATDRATGQGTHP